MMVHLSESLFFSVLMSIPFISGHIEQSVVEDLPIELERDGWLYRAGHIDKRRVPHRHEELEMNLVLHGRARYLIGDRRRDLQADSQIWLFPDQGHVLIDKSRDFEMWVVYFRQSLVNRIGAGLGSEMLKRRTPRSVLSRHLSEQQASGVSRLLSEVEAASDDILLYNSGLAYALVRAWHEFSQAPLISGHEVHPAVERAAFLIRDQPEIRGIDQLAHESGLSATRLSRLFRRQMNMSIVGYWNRQRLERFLHLYGEGVRISMTEAALDAGFGSYPQFYRIFRDHFGCGPAQYRRRGRFIHDDDPDG